MSRQHCSTCGNKFSPENVIIQNNRIGKHCKFCLYKNHAEWKRNNRKENPEKTRSDSLRWKFGIDLEKYNELSKLQFHGCAICKQPETVETKSLSVDHNHKTNQIRGLLCHNCNAALGLLKEDEDIIWNMLEYLKKYHQEIA